MRHARRRLLLQAAVLSAGVGGFLPAIAAPIKGTIYLPPELRAGRSFFGHWRVENTNVALQPASLRGGTVVMIIGPRYQAIPPKHVSVEISGLQANPAAVVVSEGTVVEFKNSDKVAHDLSVPGQPNIMPPERLSPGTVRKQRFAVPGEYVVRCSEYPHIAISVLVTSSPYFAVADDRGNFRIADVPEGHATLKVWSSGRWVKEGEIDIPARGLDLTVKVGSAPLPTEGEPAQESTE